MGHENDYEIHLEEQKEIAHAKGHAEGIAKGIEEGVAKGREEASRDNARALKALGVDVQIIAQGTGLSVEEINNL